MNNKVLYAKDINEELENKYDEIECAFEELIVNMPKKTVSNHYIEIQPSDIGRPNMKSINPFAHKVFLEDTWNGTLTQIPTTILQVLAYEIPEYLKKEIKNYE